NTAFNDPNPVLFFEHKALYRSIRQEVPSEYFTIPFGQAALLKEGGSLSIITYGAPVHWALDALEEFPELQVDLLDLRCLQPLDKESIIKSVQKTGKVLLITEDTLFGSIASDIAAMIAEECFQFLDAPIARLGSLETPVPFAAALENVYLAKSRIVGKIKEIVSF
ncbi:MAG: transketolase C-terminal domain-containing protein, partial [Gillisia sp.]